MSCRWDNSQYWSSKSHPTSSSKHIHNGLSFFLLYQLVAISDGYTSHIAIFCISAHILQAMVRPRTGDFFYSTSELEVMIEDIQIFKALGVRGVVFGILTCGGRIDMDRTKEFGRYIFCDVLLKLTHSTGLYSKLYQWKVPTSVTSSV